MDFVLGDENLGSASLSGLETLSFFKDNTTFQAFEEVYVNFDQIIGVGGSSLSSFDTDEDGVGVSLVGAGSTLNLSTVTVSDVVTNLTAIKTEFTSGFNITDANDSIGRTLTGSAKNDTLSGLGGDDIFVMGGGKDILVGGAGNDTFQIAASSDITSGIELSGGAGTDTLTVTSTDVSALNFLSQNTSLATLETLNITGGATGGVAVSIGNDALDFTTLTADGTADSLSVFSDFGGNDVDLRGITLTDVETVSMTQASFQQFMRVDADTTFTGVTTISGTVNGSTVDEQIFVNGDRDFSGITFTNIDLISLSAGSGTRQTLGVDSTTSLGITKISGFEQGTESTTDVFDYKSALVSPADGTTSISGSSDLTITSITSTSGGAAAISGNTSGVIEFQDYFDLGGSGNSIDLSTASSSSILAAIEEALESRDSATGLTGSSTQVAAGAANTDALLIFYEFQSSSSGSAVIRYQEGSSKDDDFNGELSIVAIFENVSDFENANVI